MKDECEMHKHEDDEIISLQAQKNSLKRDMEEMRKEIERKNEECKKYK